MADHQASRAAAASGNMRGRFDFPRTKPAEDTTSQPAAQGRGAGNSWIWGSTAIGGNPIGGTFGGTTRAPVDDAFLQATTSSSAGDAKQGSSSLLPGSGEHTSWATKPTVTGWAGTDATSPGIPNVNLNQDLSRSPVRIRSNGKYESPKQPTDVPRSSSPYYPMSRQGAVGQSPNGKPLYEASGNTFGEPLPNTTNRGRPLEIGQFSSTQRFAAAAAQGDVADRRHLGTTSGGLDSDEQHLRRGRGLSGSRGVVSDLLGPSSAGRSESLPPQQRPTSTPPTNPDITLGPTNGAFSAYTHLPISHPVGQTAIQPTSSYQSVVGGRFGDLSRDTREAEVLAQLKQISVEENNEGVFTGRQNRAPYPSFSQNSAAPTVNYPPQPPFPEYPYQRHGPQGSHGSSAWGQDDAVYRVQEPFEYPVEMSYSELRPYERNGTMSPGGQNGEYNRRSLGSPYYPVDTPPSGMDFRSPSRGGSQGMGHLHPEKLRQQLLATQQQQIHGHGNPAMMRDQIYRQSYSGQSHYGGYEGGYNGMRGPSQSYSGSMSPLMPPTHPGSRRQEEFSSLRSVLLEEFRSNSKSNKRYELKDIYEHVVEFSGDQHGSRFIQQKLETANSDEKETIFSEIRPNSLQLMTDVFGNYVIQKFFEHGNQLQKSILAKQMEGHVLSLSLQMYGCRVVQKALEHILTEQQAVLVKELDGHVLKCVKDQNGNHVVQKAIERVPAEHIQFIINAFNGQVQTLATHPYGCRVIQRMLEHCDEKAQASILKELHVCTYALVQDQYGNYVTQHVIEHGKPEDRAKIIDLVTAQLLQFSKHKFASNVVEKSIAFGSPDQKREIVRVVTTLKPDGSSPLHLLMRDQYGNYVIQKLLTLLSGEDRETLVEQIKPQLQALKKFTYGKQINAIEKLIFSSGTPSTQASSPIPAPGLLTPPQSIMQASEVSSPPPTSISSTSGEAATTESKGVALDG